jgi:hypothetical protein
MFDMVKMSVCLPIPVPNEILQAGIYPSGVSVGIGMRGRVHTKTYKRLPFLKIEN